MSRRRKKRCDVNHLVLYGPPCSGKGRSVSGILSTLPDETNHIGTGNLTRARSATDKEFESKYKGQILIPTDVIMSMALKKYHDGLNERKKLHVWDGVPREPEQIEKMLAARLLKSLNTTLIVLDAELEVCLERHNDPSAKKNRAGRNDARFIDRYHDHYDRHGCMLQRIYNAGIRPIFIDANQSLEEVSGRIFEIALKIIYPTLRVNGPVPKPAELSASHTFTTAMA